VNEPGTLPRTRCLLRSDGTIQAHEHLDGGWLTPKLTGHMTLRASSFHSPKAKGTLEARSYIRGLDPSLATHLVANAGLHRRSCNSNHGRECSNIDSEDILVGYRAKGVLTCDTLVYFYSSQSESVYFLSERHKTGLTTLSNQQNKQTQQQIQQ
jgi:hypothetical protein